MIVLIGLEVAYTHQYQGAQSRPSLEEQGMEGLRTSLDVYLSVAAHFEKADGEMNPARKGRCQTSAIPHKASGLLYSLWYTQIQPE